MVCIYRFFVWISIIIYYVMCNVWCSEGRRAYRDCSLFRNSWLAVLICTIYQIRKLAYLKKEEENETDTENVFGNMHTEVMIDFCSSYIGREKYR